MLPTRRLRDCRAVFFPTSLHGVLTFGALPPPPPPPPPPHHSFTMHSLTPSSLTHPSLTTHFIIITHSPLFAHSPSSSSLTHHALTHSVITHSSLTDHCSRLPRIIITHSPHLTTVGCGARSLTTHSLIIITHSPLFALHSPRIIITHSPALRKTLNATKRTLQTAFWGFDRA